MVLLVSLAMLFLFTGKYPNISPSMDIATYKAAGVGVF